jgi:hypothetical protein
LFRLSTSRHILDFEILDKYHIGFVKDLFSSLKMELLALSGNLLM